MIAGGIDAVVMQEHSMKTTIRAAVAAVLAGTLLAGCALADPAGSGTTGSPPAIWPGPYGMGAGMMGHGPMMGMGSRGMGPGAMMASGPSVETLKSELGIKPSQEDAWNAYAKVLQDTGESIQATHQGIDFVAIRNMSVEDRQAFMTQMRTQRQEQFQTLSTAAKALVATLDDTQKGKAEYSLPGLAGPMLHSGMGGMGRGWGPPGQ